MSWRVLAVGLISFGLAAAGSAADAAPEQWSPRGPQADFFLYVSNQSRANPRVRIRAEIDGVHVVDDYFDVGNQHTWILHRIRLRTGRHVLRVVAPETGLQFTRGFSLPNRRWAVLNYWAYQGQPEYFHLQVLKRRPLFR